MSRAGKRLLTEETGERIAEALEGISGPLAVEEALAIVCNGNTAPANIASGKYLFIKNHSSLPAGGYHAIAAISAGDTLNLSNVEPDEDGIANSLSEHIATKSATVSDAGLNFTYSRNVLLKSGNTAYVLVYAQRSEGIPQYPNVLFNVPAEYRPSAAQGNVFIPFVARGDNAFHTGMAILETNGEVTIAYANDASGCTLLYLFGSYIIL